MFSERFGISEVEIGQTIDPDLIYLTGKLKEGSFSVIRTGTYKDGTSKENKKIAAKEFKGNDKAYKKICYLKDMKALQVTIKGHKNLVEIIGSYIGDNQLYLIMRFEVLLIDGELINDLHAYLIYLRRKCELRSNQILENTNKEEVIDLCNISPDDELHNFVIQIAEGCAYLQEKGIIHGDLATRNILINQYKNIKLSDYGFINMKAYMLQFQDLCGFPYLRWASPEGIEFKQYSIRGDVWSFGIVVWEIGTLGALPYGDLNNAKFLELRQNESKTKKKYGREPHKTGDNFINLFTDMSKSFMKECWRIKPEKRPVFSDIFNQIRFKSPKKEDRPFYKSLNIYNHPLKRKLRFLETKADLDAQMVVNIGEFGKELFKKIEPAGRGTFGEVFKYKIINDILWKNKDVAIKILDTQDEKYGNRVKLFSSEIDDIRRMGKHENIVEIIGTFMKPLSVMMEYHSLHLDNGHVILSSLDKYLIYLREPLRKKFIDVWAHFKTYVDHQELGWFAVQIARGMSHLEEKKIVHSNLAARNILINNAKILKISDFGYQGQWLYKGGFSTEVKLSNAWAAPEVVLHDDYTSKSDVWAFGVVLWEIGTLGEHPLIRYDKEMLEDVISAQSSVRLVSRKGIISMELFTIMLSCWIGNSLFRPDFKRLLFQIDSLRSRQNIYAPFTSTSIRSLGPTKELQNQAPQNLAFGSTSSPFPPPPPPLQPSFSQGSVSASSSYDSPPSWSTLPNPYRSPPSCSTLPNPYRSPPSCSTLPNPYHSPPFYSTLPHRYPPPYRHPPPPPPPSIHSTKTLQHGIIPSRFTDYPSSFPPRPMSGQNFPQSFRTYGSQETLKQTEIYHAKKEAILLKKFGTLPRDCTSRPASHAETRSPSTSSNLPRFTPVVQHEEYEIPSPSSSKTLGFTTSLPRKSFIQKSDSFKYISSATSPELQEHEIPSPSTSKTSGFTTSLPRKSSIQKSDSFKYLSPATSPELRFRERFQQRHLPTPIQEAPAVSHLPTPSPRGSTSTYTNPNDNNYRRLSEREMRSNISNEDVEKNINGQCKTCGTDFSACQCKILKKDFSSYPCKKCNKDISSCRCKSYCSFKFF